MVGTALADRASLPRRITPHQVNVRQNFTVLQIDVLSTTDPNIAAILAMVTELWGRMGLDEANPVTFTDTGISFGGVNINITGPQHNKTAQRQP